MSRNYFDRAQQRVINSLLRDAKDLLDDAERLTLPHGAVVATLHSIGKMFTDRAKEMENA